MCGLRATNKVGLRPSSSSMYHPGHRSTAKREARVSYTVLREELFVTWLVFYGSAVTDLLTSALGFIGGVEI